MALPPLFYSCPLEASHPNASAAVVSLLVSRLDHLLGFSSFVTLKPHVLARYWPGCLCSAGDHSLFEKLYEDQRFYFAQGERGFRKTGLLFKGPRDLQSRRRLWPEIVVNKRAYPENYSQVEPQVLHKP